MRWWPPASVTSAKPWPLILQTPIYTPPLEQLYEFREQGVVFRECRRIDSQEQPLEPYGRFDIFSVAGAQRVSSAHPRATAVPAPSQPKGVFNQWQQ